MYPVMGPSQENLIDGRGLADNMQPQLLCIGIVYLIRIRQIARGSWMCDRFLHSIRHAPVYPRLAYVDRRVLSNAAWPLGYGVTTRWASVRLPTQLAL